MRKVLIAIATIAALFTAISLLAQAPAGQGNIGLFRNQPPVPTGPAPKFADGTPDLTGVWLGGGASDADIANPRSLKEGSKVVMLPWAEALVKTRQSKEDPEANCLPAGIP